MTTTARQLTGLVVAVAGTLALLTLTLGIGQQAHQDLGRYFLYQAVALLVAVAVVVTVRFITGSPLPRWGDLSAPPGGAGSSASPRARAGSGWVSPSRSSSPSSRPSSSA